MQPDRCLHVCLLGDPGTGQSEFLRAYRSGAGGEVPDGEVENMVAVVELDGEAWCVRFTDNVGHKRFDSMRHTALQISHVVLLCFAVDDQDSLQGVINNWLPVLQATESEAPPYFLVGLKADARVKGSEKPLADQEYCRDLALRCGAMDYMECTALHPESVQLVLDEALAAATEYYGLQWQLDPEPAAALVAKASVELSTEDGNEPWLAHERQNVHEDPRPLSLETLQKNLSMMGRTFSRQHAYLRLDAAGYGLTSIDAVRPFQHLQFVNVSRNQLRTLEPLGVLRSMLHLNASFNQLIRTQCFTAPDGLETVDMSYNMIYEVGDWGVHKYLRELNLRGNLISQIGEGLQTNQELRMLDLSENCISRVEFMDGLGLNMLHLAQNQLASLEGVSTLSQLQVLNVRHNHITSISALRPEDLPKLRKLCVTDNRISEIAEVIGLEAFPVLADLQISPNPIVELPHYRAQVLHRLPRLRSLDAQIAPAEEKVKADLIYGVDVEQRQQTFNGLLPDEKFVDRRLVTEGSISAAELERFGQQGNTGPYGRAGFPESDVTFAHGQTGRTRLQDATYRQRLYAARRGGDEEKTADFANFSAPFSSIVVDDEDIFEILEAVAEGGVQQLLLGPCDLSAAGVREIVRVMAMGNSTLRYADLSGTQVVRGMCSELLNTLPLAKGCSLETTDCGLSSKDEAKLRNQTPEAEAALAQAAQERQRSASMIEEYLKAQEALEDKAAEDCDRENPPLPPPLLCHPLKWRPGVVGAAQESLKAFRCKNPGPISAAPLKVLRKSGQAVTLAPDERLALCQQRDRMLEEWGLILEREDEDAPAGATTGAFGRPLPEAFEAAFPECWASDDFLAYMLWEGVEPAAGVVAGIRRKREEWEGEWRQRSERRQELTQVALEHYDSEEAPMHVASGQLIAHFTYLFFGGDLRGGPDSLKLFSAFGLKHLAESPRTDPSRGVDLHRALADGLVQIEAATGHGFGDGALELKLTSDSELDIKINVRRGTIFQHVDWQQRANLLVAYDYIITLPAQGGATRTMNAYCMNVGCACSNGNPLALTEFYLDDDAILESQGKIWDHFESCFASS